MSRRSRPYFEITVKLYFDGSVSPNPGPGGWGSVASVTFPSSSGNRVTNVPNFHGKLGHGTNNAAEYMGLIGGLRGVIRFLQTKNLRATNSSIEVNGDSQLVIQQMQGRRRVVNERIAVLHQVAKSLERRFGRVAYRLVERNENPVAHEYATNARKGQCEDSAKVVYYPSLFGLINTWILGESTLASHDVGTAGDDPSFFVDARYLYSLPGGPNLLRNMEDPYPLSFVLGKEDMSVLGVIDLEIGVECDGDRNTLANETALKEGCARVIVVESFPVPLHVSIRDPHFKLIRDVSVSREIPFDKDSLDGHFKEHPYWQSEIIFLSPSLFM